MQAVGLVGGVLAVAVDERRELLGVAVALACELLAEVEDVGLVAMAVGDLAERGGEVDLRLVEKPEVVRDVRHLTPPSAW